MSELHIIVHEDAVKAYANIGSGAAKQALDEIERIKTSQKYLGIPSHHEPKELHPDMPLPTDDLQVFVSGGYRDTCCLQQLFALREAGYKAKFHPIASCPGRGRLPSTMLREIETKYPDLYD